MANHNRDGSTDDNESSPSNSRLPAESNVFERRTVLKGAASAAAALPFLAGPAQGATGTRRLAIVSTTEPAERNTLDVDYEFTTTGEISKVTDGRTTRSEGNDSVTQHDDGTWTASGTTGNGFGDTYDFAGEVQAFSGEGDFELRLDGTVVTHDELVSTDDHVIEIITNAQSEIEYTFRTTGEITKEFYRGDDSAEVFRDTVSENDDGTWTADGYTGHGYGDTYTYSGTLEDFGPVEDFLEVRVDGTPIDLSQFTGDPSDGDDGQTVLSASGASRTSAPIQTEHGGHTGDGYINFAASGSSATWTVEVDAAGTYGLDVDYALGDGASRTANLLIDGEAFEITAEPTDDWSTWATLPLAVDLPAGSFDVAIETTGADWGNVDRAVLRDEPAADAVEPATPEEPPEAPEGGGAGFAWDQTFTDTSWVTDAGDDLNVETVTNTDVSGSGSLQAAIDAASGPTVIVFEAGGVIDLRGSGDLDVGPSNVWIAGETAPDPGISVVGGGIVVDGSEVIVSHVGAYLGDEGGTGEALKIYGDDVVFDHCSAFWGVDEVAGASDPVNRCSFINCIVAEGLHESIHPDGQHSRGMLFNDAGDEICVMGCLFANNNRRHPMSRSDVVLVNNYIYNGGWDGELVHFNSGANPMATSQGLYVEDGPNSASGDAIHLYSADLYYDDIVSEPSGRQVAAGSLTILDSPQLVPPGLDLTADSVAGGEAKSFCLSNAGMRPANRPSADSSFIQNRVGGNNGASVDSQSDVGGYPGYSTTSRSLRVPSTGIVDWLRGHTSAVEGST